MLSIQVEDAGVGFDSETIHSPSETSGLAGMRERAILLSGQLTIESAVGTGTRLTAELGISESASTDSRELEVHVES